MGGRKTTLSNDNLNINLKCYVTKTIHDTELYIRDTAWKFAKMIMWCMYPLGYDFNNRKSPAGSHMAYH